MRSAQVLAFIALFAGALAGKLGDFHVEGFDTQAEIEDLFTVKPRDDSLNFHFEELKPVGEEWGEAVKRSQKYGDDVDDILQDVLKNNEQYAKKTDNFVRDTGKYNRDLKKSEDGSVMIIAIVGGLVSACFVAGMITAFVIFMKRNGTGSPANTIYRQDYQMAAPPTNAFYANHQQYHTPSAPSSSGNRAPVNYHVTRQGREDMLSGDEIQM